MRIGVPKEIKVHEYRVGLTPDSARELIHRGHAVAVERGAGATIGFSDADYRAAGADIRDTAAEVWADAELVVKVKEPQPAEYPLLRAGQVLFTYLHLAPDPRQADALLAAGGIAIAYETVTDDHGGLPLLAPMSIVAGRMAVQVGAHWLEIAQGGRGVLLGGVPGVAPARVVVLGAGNVGSQAARMAVGLGAEVSVINRGVDRLEAMDREFGGRIRTLAATRANVEAEVRAADLVVGAVLVVGGAAPKLIDRVLLAQMKPGAVIVDVAIDQGGCCETSRPTTHADPTYVVDGVTHYCVANMPGAVARTSTLALNNATLPRVAAIADHGWQAALAADPHLRAGLNVCAGRVTHPAVAKALGMPYKAPETLLAATV